MGWLLILIIYSNLGVASGNNENAYYAMNDEEFFSLPATQKLISFAEPDTFLLDVALFHATNKARRENSLPPFQNDVCLNKASAGHARSMITRNFYGHTNPYSPFERTAEKRVDLCTQRFRRVAENIGRYQTITGKDVFLARWNKEKGQYEFLDADDYSSCGPYTYGDFALHVVKQWMSSPPHKANILNSAYTYLGCAAKFSENPFKQRRLPYASVVQNFGGEN